MLPRPADPHAGVRRFEGYDRARGVHDRCEVAVVGSGPGGAVAAKELAEAGLDVVLLEEGTPLDARDFVQEAGESMQRTLREGGSRATRGNVVMPTMQAIALGGGSVINSAICARPPAWVLERWSERAGTDALGRAALDPHFDRVEAQLGVAPTPAEVQGERNLRFKRGCDALGITSEPTWRNVQSCLGSAECFTGCRNGAKRSVDVSYVPAAMRAGARVYTSVRIERVTRDGRRATGVRGRIVEPFAHASGGAGGSAGRTHGEVRIDADVVVLAAGCMATPLLLERSGIGERSGWVGRDLRFHPGLAVMAVFPERIDPWKGATQGYHSLHYLREGLKLEVLWSPPAVLAARLPGIGHEYQEHLLRYDHMAPFDVICAADRSSGEVRARGDALEPEIRFHFHQDDVALMQRGLGILAEICWAAGAEAILPGLHGVPDVVRSRREAEAITRTPLRAEDTITAANHAFCSTRMGRTEREGVVDAAGRCHDTDNVYVVDTGIFPSSPGVNPMLTCMALADRIALGIAASRP
jgi:choline dehydrogenase-like flavoprotein